MPRKSLSAALVVACLSLARAASGQEGEVPDPPVIRTAALPSAQAPEKAPPAAPAPQQPEKAPVPAAPATQTVTIPVPAPVAPPAPQTITVHLVPPAAPAPQPITVHVVPGAPAAAPVAQPETAAPQTAAAEVRIRHPGPVSRCVAWVGRGLAELGKSKAVITLSDPQIAVAKAPQQAAYVLPSPAPVAAVRVAPVEMVPVLPSPQAVNKGGFFRRR